MGVLEHLPRMHALAAGVDSMMAIDMQQKLRLSGVEAGPQDSSSDCLPNISQ